METAALKPRAARPRDAAALVIVDRSGDEPRVLMGRRGVGHSFLPGKWVFPGGAIDRGDVGVAAASEPAADMIAALGARLSPRRARALVVAAVRETFEETGLILGSRTGDPRANNAFARAVAPDLAALCYVARLVTPPHMPRRFDTRFFMADAARWASREPRDTRELEQLDWFALDRAADLGLLEPTRIVLAHLRGMLNGRASKALSHRFDPRTVPA